MAFLCPFDLYLRLLNPIVYKEAQNMNFIANEMIPVHHPDFCNEITAILRRNLAPRSMREKICTYHEKDIALALSRLSREEGQRLFRILPVKDLATVLEYAQSGATYFDRLSIRQKTEVLSCMEIPAASELLKQLSKEERSSLLELLDPDVRREIRLICSFDKDEIGSRMSTNFIRIAESSTVKEAMSQLICQAAENDNITTLYLVDEAQTFCGTIDLKDLIIAREGTPLSEITTVSYPYLYAKTPIEDCIPLLTDYAEASIPVLDDENKLVGVVTAQDAVGLLDDEMGDDYAKLAGLSSEEDLSEPITRSLRKRLPWLCVLLVMGLGVSAVVGLFESIVAQLPIIMCFQSLILDMAGNVGTQSLAVAIRVLMDAQLDRRHKAALVWKEMRVGLLNGGILGLMSFAAIGVYLCLIGNAAGFSFAVSGCLGIAMVLAMSVSSLFGTLIPLFFKHIGIDPAVASGPLITTVNDLVAVVSYYGLSWLILLNLLHLG